MNETTAAAAASAASAASATACADCRRSCAGLHLHEARLSAALHGPLPAHCQGEWSGLLSSSPPPPPPPTMRVWVIIIFLPTVECRPLPSYLWSLLQVYFPWVG